MQYLQRHFTDDEIESLLDQAPLTGEHGLRRMLGEIDVEYWALAYIGEYFDKPFCEFHNDLIERVKSLVSEYSCNTTLEKVQFRQEKTGNKLLTIAPRGHGKSKIITVLCNLWCLVYKKSPFILCISANESLAQDFLDSVKDALESNPKIREDFGDLKGKTWNASQIELTNDTCLIAKGIKSKIRGISWREWRPTLIIMDDIEDDKGAKSELSTDEIKHIIRNTVLSCGDRYSDFVFVGTIISESTYINDLYKSGTGWNKVFYQAVKSFSESSLWQQWEKIYTDLANPNCIDDAYNFFLDNQEEMLEDTSVLWNDKNNYYFLMKKKIDEGESAFWAEQQNDPRSSSDYAFQKLSYWDELPDVKEQNTVLFVDPSMGKTKGDFSALTILGKHKVTGYKYVINGQLHKVKPNELIEIIIKMCKEHDYISTIGFESVNFQEYVASDLKKRLKEEEMYHVIVKDVKPRTNKHNRIMNLEPFITRGELKFNKDCVQYNNQIKDYNINARNDDAPDSLQGAFEIVEKFKKPKKVMAKPSGW
jgi:predicted phage terminase large subunit-like protein